MSKGVTSKVKTQTAVAGHLGVDRGKICKWLNERNIKPPYDIDKIRISYIKELSETAGGRVPNGDINLAEERALLAREQRERIVLDRMTKSKELLPTSAVVRMWSGIISELRTKILNTDLSDQSKSDLIDSLREIGVDEYV